MVASSAFAQKDRKVPPRTPSQRFETLNRFINEWIDYNIDQDLNRPMRAYNMVSQKFLDQFHYRWLKIKELMPLFSS